MADKEVNLTLKVDAAAAIKAIKEEKEAIKKLKEEEKLRNEEQKKQTKEEKERASAVAALAKQKQKALEKQLIESQKQTKQQVLESQAANSAKGSYEQLSAQYRLNVIQLNSMGEAERKTTEKGKALTKETLSIRTAMADAKKETGDNTLNVANYSESIKIALTQSGLFGGVIRSVTAAQTAYKTATKLSTAATIGSSKAMKILKIAFISTGIGAIVVALGSLVAYLTTTQKGMDFVTKAAAPLKVIFEKLVGVFQNTGESLFNAFSNPKQAMLDLYDFVKTNLINRFKAFGVILEGIINLDFEKVGNGLLQVTTGVEDVIGKTKKLSKELSEATKIAIDQGSQLSALSIKIEEREINLNKQRAIATDYIKEQELIAKNTLKTDEERQMAIDNAIAKSKEIADSEKGILDLRIERMRLEQSFNDTSREEQKELADLEAQRIELDTKQKASELRFITVKSSLTKAALAEEAAFLKDLEDQAAEELSDFDSEIESEIQKELDKRQAVKDATDAWDSENEELEAETQEEKNELELERLQEEYAMQLEMLKEHLNDKLLSEEEYADAVEKLNKNKALKEKAISKDVKESGEENQIGLASTIASTSSEMFEDSKALAAANVGLSAASAIVKTWDGYAKFGPFGTAAAVAQTALIGGTALAQTANIAGVKLANGGFLYGASHAGGGINMGFGQEAEGGEFVTSKATMANPQLSGIVQAANSAGNSGQSLSVGVTEERVAEIAASVVGSIPVNIVESEMTDMQKKVSVRESEFNG